MPMFWFNVVLPVGVALVVMLAVGLLFALGQRRSARSPLEPGPPGEGTRPLEELAWGAATAGSVAVLALVPLVFNRRFYFADDTQAGAYPIWVSIGEHLRAGHLPFFEPTRWMSGNYPAEGQWGLFNPVVWFIGWFVSGSDDGVVASSVVKIVALVVAGVGVYLLARSYEAQRVWAFVGGVLVPAAGFTMYVDSGSWVTSLFVWALVPWVWAAFRGVVFHGRNPLLPFVAGYVLITVGYVHGTLLMCCVILGVLVEALLARRVRDALKGFGVGVTLGLVALAVYLPGIRSAAVTVRDSVGILNSNFMSPDLSGLVTAGTPFAQPWLTGFWAPPAGAPLMYIAWILPLVAFLDARKVSEVLARSAGLLVVGVLAAVLVFGPSDIGPLRFPARVYPYLALVVVVTLVVLLSRARAETTRGRVVAAGILVVVGAAFGWFEAPAAWEVLAVGVLVTAAGLAAVLVVVHRGDTGHRLAAVVLAVTCVVTIAQHYSFRSSPLPDFGLPAEVSAYEHALEGVEGDVMVIGDPLRERSWEPGSEWWRSTLYANAWYLSDTSVVNTYSPILHRNYAADLCVDAHGVVCWETLDKLMTPDEATGVPLADLLSLSALQVLSRSDEGPDPISDPYENATPPEGWHVESRDDVAALWVRDKPVDQAGGIVHTSDGVTVSDVKVTKREVTFHVDQVSGDGGQVVFSRLNWPGYTMTGATEGTPLRGYLLTANLAGGSAGTDVTVRFSPPGWTGNLVLLFAGISGAVMWGAAHPIVRGVRGRRHLA